MPRFISLYINPNLFLNPISDIWMESRGLGTLLLIAGFGVVIVGALVYFGAPGWFGRLPGDVRIERGATRVYMPFASMIIVSLILSILFSLVRRLF